MPLIVLDPRRPTLVPAEAAHLLAGKVLYTEDVPIRVIWNLNKSAAVPLDFEIPPDTDEPTVLTMDSHHEVRSVFRARQLKIIEVPRFRGEALLDAVELMDKLRALGPWERDQTHRSLRRYLVEETYELLDAIDAGVTTQIRDELSDVLLQVLFHARIGQDAPHDPFDIDDVARSFIAKVTHRSPQVLSGEPVDLDTQLAMWEEQKAALKAIENAASGHPPSILDDVALHQPALALTQKVLRRLRAAQFPVDLIPSDLLAISLDPMADGDPEDEQRQRVLTFIAAVKSVEAQINTDDMCAESWRVAWTNTHAEEDNTPEASGPEAVEDDSAASPHSPEHAR